jgi:hypothetical protein
MSAKSLFALPIALVIASPAVAGISKSVSVEDALEGRVPIVVAVEGGGVNVDFSETGETVRKVTLDDSSKVLVDFDKSLPIVRLFRGNVSSKDVPNAKTTQLSVTTEGPEGDFHLYIFPVTTALKPAIYTKFLIGGVTRRRGFNTTATAAVGARVAEQNRTLVDPRLKARVSHYVQLRTVGMSDSRAAKKAGVSIALAKRLDELGQSAPSSITPPVAVVPAPVVPTPVVMSRSQSQTPSQVLRVPSPVPNPVSEFQPQPKSAQKSQQKPRLFEYGSQPAPKKLETVKPEQTVSLNREQSLWASAIVVPPGAAHTKQLSSAIQQRKTVSNQAYANALMRGLNKARLDGNIRYGSNRWYLVNGAVRLLRRGSSLDKAIAASGMQRDKFMKLLSDGGMES